MMTIRNVHVHDGENRILNYDTNGLGEESEPVFERAIPEHTVQSGLGVSIYIAANNARDTKLEIHAVGVDFLV